MTNSNKNSDLKSDSFLLKISPSDHDKIRKASEILHLSKSEFVLGYALKRANEVLYQTEYEHLEEVGSTWNFKGRKLSVFLNFYLLAHSEYADSEWADLYSLPVAAVREARKLCNGPAADIYKQWVEQYESEDE